MSTENLNRVANHPEVFKWISGGLDGPLDFSQVLAPGKVEYYDYGDGGFIFKFHDNGEIELHTLFLPDHTTKVVDEALKLFPSVLERGRLFTLIPEANLAARKAAEKAGFKRGPLVGEWLIQGIQSPMYRYDFR